MAKKKSTKETPREWVYEQGRDFSSVLHNIVHDIRHEKSMEIAKTWGVPVHRLKGCNLRISGLHDEPVLQLLVTELHGGFRIPAENPHVLSEKGKETLKLLSQFEKEVKKEFKHRTGKALRMKKPETDVDWQMVALNGLYRFVASKRGVCSTKLDPQEWEKD